MTFKNKLISALKKLPLGSRLSIAFVAFKGKLEFSIAPYAHAEKNKLFSDAEIEKMFEGLDEKSIDCAKRFMHRQINLPYESFLIYPKYFYTPEEHEEYKKLFPEYKKSCRKFGFSMEKVGPESLYYHHGLRFAPDYVKENIKGKLFADVGGYLGDSTLIFQEYSPEKIIIFEPLKDCREKLVNFLNKNSVDDSLYEVQPYALSDSSASVDGMECKTLDELFSDNKTPYGVLKADIEGMGLHFLKGAKNTILRDRPLLSLSIYHNEDEFAGIYQTLKEWDLNYHFEIKSFSPKITHGEYSLFAYPAEWVK